MKSKLSKTLIFSSMLLFCFFTQSCTEENIISENDNTSKVRPSKTVGNGGDTGKTVNSNKK